jgi:Na+/H+ antiporter NhaD/arsenite permease-like protein
MGPPSGAGSIGAATATYVVARPSTNTISLITFFMGSLLVRTGLPISAEACTATDYTGYVQVSKLFVLFALTALPYLLKLNCLFPYYQLDR